MINESCCFTNIRKNQSEPYFAAHTYVVTSIRTPDCTSILSYNYSSRCDFLKNTRLSNETENDPGAHCDSFVAMFDYLDILYCKLNVGTSAQENLAIVFFFFILLYYFIILGVTADTYFCPALTVLAKFLKLNDTIAGVTLLAFGNGSPDLFTSFSTKDSESPTLLYQLLGAAIFVTAFISSIILVIHPFKIGGAEFTRDCSFLIFAIGYLDLILTDGYVTVLESVGIFMIYVVYIAVIILDQILINIEKRERHKYVGSLLQNELVDVTRMLNLAPPNSSAAVNQNVAKQIKPKLKFWKGPLIKQFGATINPINSNSWNDSSKISKLMAILKSPIVLILHFLLPAVDFDKELNGWSKLLNCLQITILPTLFTLQTMPSKTLYNLAMCIFVMICCLPITVILLSITKTDKAPRFHIIYTVLTIAGSIWIIKVFADEIINILTSVGIVIKMTQSFLAVTFLAMGNSIGDLVTNIVMARQGHQKMGYSACFGGPLFNLIFGMGVVCITRSMVAHDKRLPLSEGSIGDNCVIFMLIFLCFSLLGLSFVHFRGTRRIGSFGILIYIIFMVYIILSVTQTIHEYGTDHREDEIFDST